MPLHIETSVYNFVQWDEADTIQACNWAPLTTCLPVYDENDVWFQVILRGDTQEEVDELCDQDNEAVRFGIALSCLDDATLFDEKPIRYRVGATRLLYYWNHGVPGLAGLVRDAQCFRFKLEAGIYTFCSNCFQRITEDCHTSVLEYSNKTNAFGFNYCAGSIPGQDDVETCDPTLVQFNNVPGLSIPYTAYLQAKYGTIPTVEVWVYDEMGDLIRPGVLVKFDDYPPTQLIFDFGGTSSGVIKIM